MSSSSDALLQQLLERERDQPDVPELLFTLGALFQHRKQIERAAAYYARGLKLQPDVFEAWTALAGIRSVQGLFAEAIAAYRRSLALEPHQLPAWFGLANLLVRQGHAEFENCYRELLQRFPQLRQTPSILFNTLPRSASIFITTALRLMLQREFLMVAEIDSADNAILPLAAACFAQGGVVSQAHLPATPHNLAVMNACLDRLVIHVRDPRQAVLSLVYLFRRQQAAGPDRIRFQPPLPPDYLERSLAEQIDWNLTHYYPVLIRWIEGWLDVREQGGFDGQLLFTRYEDFHADAEGFYRQLLDFYGLTPLSREIVGYTPPEGYLNFRKGDPAEWREVFSRRQLALANALLPLRLQNLFSDMG